MSAQTLKLLDQVSKSLEELYLLNLLIIVQVDTMPVVRYWSEVLCCTIVTHLSDLEVKFVDFKISCLGFWLKFSEFLKRLKDELSRIVRNRNFAYAKTKAQISFAVTAKLISAFVFATRIVQFLFFLNPKFQAFSLLL